MISVFLLEEGGCAWYLGLTVWLGWFLGPLDWLAWFWLSPTHSLSTTRFLLLYMALFVGLLFLACGFVLCWGVGNIMCLFLSVIRRHLLCLHFTLCLPTDRPDLPLLRVDLGRFRSDEDPFHSYFTVLLFSFFLFSPPSSLTVSVVVDASVCVLLF